ncbi:ATP-grasp peptide maturase system methyltransferase [Streptomyces sp. NRRL F-5126]|uniref:ATP-grasp peptide maturase system methyltransferase n=1 Tax=Streptomyces sp. NRRL F-5126 TaxID=1463857 RepID=UPI0004C6C174|nr:ATP-grasp peptide maturase system methyltransferase [Streptomyces sp. NRRL F-5126]
MTELDLDRTAAGLRHELVEHLAAEGQVTDPEWRAAVQDVPRHEFAPRFYVMTDAPGMTTYVPISPELVGTEAWLRKVYSDETLITQFDGCEIDWSDPQPIRGASPTSSSTLPSLVVQMLEALDADAEATVTEYGTGTGYSSALMCHRFGAGQVTSVETDPGVAARARAALERCGYTPRLVVGNGLAGADRTDRAARTIATMGVRGIPWAWLRETQPGGLIVATLRGWLRSLGLVRLVVEDGQRATGRFLAGSAFMMARQQEAPANLGMLPGDDDGKVRETPHGPEVLRMPDSGFVAQLAMPNARTFDMPADDGALRTYVLDAANESFAILSRDGDGWTVREGGPVSLWGEVERSLALWHAAGAPTPTKFGVSVEPDRQRIWLEDAADGPSWWLPVVPGA